MVNTMVLYTLNGTPSFVLLYVVVDDIILCSFTSFHLDIVKGFVEI